MRIISGKHKGRKLFAPKKLPIRPTTDRSKESIFNILNNYFYFNEISVIDLFSGSGNISFEFSSRGCKNIVSVDNNLNCINYINKINNKLDLNITVIQSDVNLFLSRNTNKVDIVFADPPYSFKKNELVEIVSKTINNHILKKGGILIIEHSSELSLDDLDCFFINKTYGNNKFSFFKEKASE